MSIAVRLLAALGGAAIILWLTAGTLLADSAAPGPGVSAPARIPLTPTPRPAVACPSQPLSATIVLTYSAWYYEAIEETNETIPPALTQISSTFGSVRTGISSLHGLLGISEDEGGGDLPSESGFYNGLTFPEMAEFVVSGVAEIFTWLRAIGEMSATGLAVVFLLLSLAFIMFVVLLKATLKSIFMVIGLLIQAVAFVMQFVPFF